MKPARVAAIACALFLFACGGGGGGGGSSGPTPATNLAGTWVGNYEAAVGTMFAVSVTIDATGKITQILRGTSGNMVNQNLTGNIFVAGTNLYSFTLSDGATGGFFADASATHAAFVDIDFNVGVLQKGAAVPTNTTFAATDIVGAWTGYNVDTDANLNVVRTFTSNATVADNLTRTFTGSDTQNGPFTGNFGSTFVAADLGRWIGRYQNTNIAAFAGDAHAFLSVDKTFAGTWVCVDSAVDFSGCTFAAWHK